MSVATRADGDLVRCPMCYSRQWTAALEFARPAALSFDRAHHRQVMRCRDCDLLHTVPRPAELSWAERYPTDYVPHQVRSRLPRWHHGWRRRWERRLLHWYRGYPAADGTPAALSRWAAVCAPLMGRMLNPYVLPLYGRRRLLDIGFGAGKYLSHMRSLGWEVVGLECSREAAARAEAAFGVPVVVEPIDAGPTNLDAFDLITAWQVLEHCDRPRRALANIRSLLAPHGRFVLTVPNQAGWAARCFGPDWLGLDLSRHVTHFTAATLTRLLTAEGFRYVHLTTLSQRGWIRRSARQMRRQPGLPFSHRLMLRWLRTRVGSRLASSLACARQQGETLYVVAEAA